MKTKQILLFFLFILAGLMLKAQQPVSEYYVTSPVSVHMPVQSDSINFKGSKFSVNELLKTPITIDFEELEYTRMVADTSGYLSLPKADKDCLFYLFATDVRAERFMYATFKIYSSARFEVYVNGESKQSNMTAADTVTKINPLSVSLRMEPQKNYNIVIKVMSAADDKMEPMLKCEIVKKKEYSDIECFVAPDLKSRLSLYETAFGSKVTNLQLSPDGKYLLMGVTESYSVKCSMTKLVLKETKSMKTILENVPYSARWMPKTNSLYYTVNGKKDKDLMMLDPATGLSSVIKRGIPEGTFYWSPTEDYLIYSKYDVNPKDSGPLRRHLTPDDRISGSRNRGYILKYDIKSGLSERLTFGRRSVFLNDISGDGKKILYISQKPAVTERPFNKYSLIELDLATMTADTLIKDEGFLKSAFYSPDMTKLLLIASPEAFGGIGKNCGEHPIANDYDNQAYIMDIATRGITPLTRNFNPVVEPLQWNRSDGCIYFITTDEDCKNIYRYIPDEEKFEKLPLMEDVITSFSLPVDAPSMAAYIGGGNTSTGVAYIYDMKKKRSQLLANPMAESFADLEFGQMEEWYFTSKTGTRIKGQKILPPDFDADKKYPLIVYYYGGTTPTTRSMTSPYAPQLFASRDYVVYVIQPSGAIGFGQEFSARHVNAWGDWTADEIIEGTEKFCEEHPFVDRNKIGCIGASYGGFMTQYLQTKTDLFAAAVSHAGISNVTSYWGEGYWGYSYNSIAAAESYPWNNPELFTKHGSLFNADKISTPLLLLHGSADTNVPIGESIQLYNALKILGKEVEFISVDGEDHFIADYSLRVSWHNTIMAWFAKWLQDSPQWWNELYKTPNL